MGTTLTTTAQNVQRAAEQVEQASKKMSKVDMTRNVFDHISNARSLISTIDHVINAIFHYSPLDEWVKKPFSGDWDAMLETAEHWEAIAKELGTLHETVGQLSAKIDYDTWSGNAAIAFVLRNNTVADAAQAGIEPCSEMATALQQATDIAQHALDDILDLIETVVDLCISIAEHLSFGPVGAILIAVEDSGKLRAALEAAAQIFETLNDLYTVMTAVGNCSTALTALVSESTSILSKFGSGYAVQDTGASTTSSHRAGSTHRPGGGASSGGFRGGSGGGVFGGR